MLTKFIVCVKAPNWFWLDQLYFGLMTAEGVTCLNCCMCPFFVRFMGAMGNKEIESLISQACEELFNFSIEREDVKWLMGQYAESSKIKSATLEYELQILKIISVGWSLSYLLEGTPKRKTVLSECFWNSINNFSRDLSYSTGLMIGQDIDYFEMLKTRLNHYIGAVQGNCEASDPAVVIGPEFAKLCGNKDDLFAIMAGSKMFANTFTRVRQYLEALKMR